MKAVLYALGQMDYLQALELQNSLAGAIAAGKHAPALLVLEHPHTYTFGRKGNLRNLLWDAEEQKKRGVSTHWVDRGGDVTYHGPGQLIGYPLIPLGKISSDPKALPVDYVGYVRKLEKMLVFALSKLGLVSGQITGLSGVWIHPDVFSRCPRCRPEDRHKAAKIAAIGVKVDANGISRHGFALNVNPDMRYFEGIIPCGLEEHTVVCLADLLSPLPDAEMIKNAIISAFEQVFGFQFDKKTFDFID